MGNDRAAFYAARSFSYIYTALELSAHGHNSDKKECGNHTQTETQRVGCQFPQCDQRPTAVFPDSDVAQKVNRKPHCKDTEKRIFAENSLKVIDGANFMSNIFKTANARGLFGVALLNSRLLYFYSRKME